MQHRLCCPGVPSPAPRSWGPAPQAARTTLSQSLLWSPEVFWTHLLSCVLFLTFTFVLQQSLNFHYCHGKKLHDSAAVPTKKTGKLPYWRFKDKFYSDPNTLKETAKEKKIANDQALVDVIWHEEYYNNSLGVMASWVLFPSTQKILVPFYEDWYW